METISFTLIKPLQNFAIKTLINSRIISIQYTMRCKQIFLNIIWIYSIIRKANVAYIFLMKVDTKEFYIRFIRAYCDENNLFQRESEYHIFLMQFLDSFQAVAEFIRLVVRFVHTQITYELK